MCILRRKKKRLLQGQIEDATEITSTNAGNWIQIPQPLAKKRSRQIVTPQYVFIEWQPF